MLGTRGSELARIQAGLVENALRRRWPEVAIERRTIQTTGDEGAAAPAQVDRHAGRKGAFTGEIERSLLAGEVDLAVHSAKDVPSDLTPGTRIAAVLPRAPVGDVLISLGDQRLAQLPANAVLATGSVRRRYQLTWQRPDIEVVDLRGNVPTRLRKLLQNRWDGIVLARAGLDRLGLTTNHHLPVEFDGGHLFLHDLPTTIFVPAGGQGIIAIQTRQNDEQTQILVEPINDSATHVCLRAEREFLRLLGADCNQPVAVLAIVEGRSIKVRAQIFDSEKVAPRTEEEHGCFEDAEKVAAALFKKIHDRA